MIGWRGEADEAEGCSADEEGEGESVGRGRDRKIYGLPMLPRMPPKSGSCTYTAPPC